MRCSKAPQMESCWLHGWCHQVSRILCCYSALHLAGCVDHEHLCADPSLLQTGKSSIIVGLAVLSFNTATREQMPTLQPPDQAAYLSNIAVDPQYRRYEALQQKLLYADAKCCHGKSSLTVLLLQARHCVSGIAGVRTDHT